MNSSTVAIAWYVDPPAFGDVNDDGRVDLTDLVLIARHYGTVLGDPGYNYLYDLNGDGRIDLIDLAAVARAIQP
jgi:Ca2+-binding EF-hand superfamily protein